MPGDALASAADRWVLGLTFAPDLRDAAVAALEEGRDSPSLRELAGLVGDDTEPAVRLFRRALAEVGVGEPAQRDAVFRLALQSARGIIDRECSPYEGARRIWDLSKILEGHPIEDLHPFIYAADEWEDRPEDRGHFDAAILEEAGRLLRRHG